MNILITRKNGRIKATLTGYKSFDEARVEWNEDDGKLIDVVVCDDDGSMPAGMRALELLCDMTGNSVTEGELEDGIKRALEGVLTKVAGEAYAAGRIDAIP